MRLTVRFRRLLAQVMQGHERLLAAVVGVQGDVTVTAALGREKADHRPRGEPAFSDDVVQHGLCLGEQLTRFYALRRVVENRWITAT